MPALAGREDITHYAVCEVKVNGAPASRDVYHDLIECQVENSLHLPDACTLRLADDKFKWAGSAQFEPGVKIQIALGLEKLTPKTVFWGEVVGCELDMNASGMPTVTVRCLNKSHRLHRGRKARTFVQMSDSDIVKQVASAMGFTVKAESTNPVHEWVMQRNQSDWDFLQERARLNGYRLYVTGENILHFQAVRTDKGAQIKAEWAKNLRSFRPRVSAATQVSKVMVRGWDPKTKRPILATKQTSHNLPSIGSANPQKAAQAFGAAEMVVVDQPVHQEREAEHIAQSVCDTIGGRFIEAEGLLYGTPELLPGARVQVDNIGTRFSGSYFVTATTHTYSPSEGYATQFAATGGSDNTLSGLLGTGGAGTDDAGGGANLAGTFGGNIVVALVTDNKDEKNLGRVKVTYPWLTEKGKYVSHWARIASPMAGKNRGFYFLPEVDDEVLVAFEHGDMRRPYIVGALWNGVDTPVETNDKATKSGKTERRTIKTRIGHTLLFDDTDGKGEISQTTKAVNRVALDDKNENITAVTTKKHTLILDDKNKKVHVKTTSGHQILLDDQGAKIVVVDKTGSNKITIDSNSNAMKLECNGNFTVEAKGKVAIKGQAGIEMDTPAQFKVNGQAGVDMKTTASMNLQATAQMSIKSTGPASVQSSATLDVKGGAMVNISGALVKIN